MASSSSQPSSVESKGGAVEKASSVCERAPAVILFQTSWLLPFGSNRISNNLGNLCEKRPKQANLHEGKQVLKQEIDLLHAAETKYPLSKRSLKIAGV
jgi:hypothetical protein